MDPDRVRAYLQVACAGLGFDIGEIWWTTNENNGSSSALAKVEEKDDALGNREKKLRFVQLYTSKSYEDRRSMLVRPADEEEDYNAQINGSHKTEDSPQDLEKHVLSPIMVDAISKTAQVVWAHTRKSEGLTGRSDIRLQTAVGMPVAVDREGNMCVVVMFSPNNIQSTDDALEYLQSISRSATSSSIPSLLPAFDPKQGLIHVPHNHSSISEVLPRLSNVLSDGVTTRFVSLDESQEDQTTLSLPEVHSDHDLVNAPRDCFGIPMLPAVAELGSSQGTRSEIHGDSVLDAFDEASYGVWSTIMQTYDEQSELDETHSGFEYRPQVESVTASNSLTTYSSQRTISKPFMAAERQDRLQEFASAFLDVSVFDLAEVWLPIGQGSDCLGLVTSVMSSDNNSTLHEFTKQSEKILIKFWSGAIGRAYSSGNPVWSFNKDVFVDSGRMSLFEQSKIETALAIPVFSGKSNTPSFVFCCYSFVRTGSVPFVLKFAQQALKLLWGGLDKVQPHASVGESIWRDVAPADLGEMAADVEMQQHFMIKKRPIGAISSDLLPDNDLDMSLALQIESLETPSGDTAVRSIYTGLESQHESMDDFVEVDDDIAIVMSPMIQPAQLQTFETVQSHIHNAIRSVADMAPVRQHISTNAEGSKRAHVFHQEQSLDYHSQQYQQVHYVQPQQQEQQQLQNQQQQNHAQYQHPQQFQQQQPQQFQQQQSQQFQQQQPQQFQQQQPQQFQQQQPQQFQQLQLSQQQSQQQSQQPQQFQQQSQQQPQQFQQQSQQQPQQFQQQSQQQPQQSQQQPQHYQQHPHQQQQFYRPQLPEPQPHQQYGQQPAVSPQQQPQYQQHPTPQFAVSPQLAPLNTDCFKSPVSAPLPLPRPLPLPNQVVRPGGSNSPSFLQRTQDPFDSTSHQALPSLDAIPDRVVEVPDYNQQHYDNSSSYAIPGSPHQQEPSPNPVYSVPVEQLSATGISFSLPPTHVGLDQTMTNQSPLFCIPVGEDELMDAIMATNGKSCRIQGCSEAAVARRPYCVRHSGNRMCEHEGCPKCAQGSTRYCIAHGGGRRCTYPGCDKGARDKFFCAAHGGGKRCKFDGCDKSAVGGSSLCTAHGGGRRCTVDGCDKSAQSSTRFCVKHGGGKKCSNPSCEKVARGRTQYCAAHGGGVRCKLAGCNRVAIGKLQLCRAHGGGARPKNDGGSIGSSSSNSLPMLSDSPVAAQQAIFQPLTSIDGFVQSDLTTV